MKLDLHVHTNHSPDSILTHDDYKTVFESGKIDVIAITDHDEIKGAQAAQQVFGPEKIIVGQEITTDKKKHVIGLFLTKFVPSGLPAERIAELIKNQGGLVYIPHPLEPANGIGKETLDSLREKRLLDIVEDFNAWVEFSPMNPSGRKRQNLLAQNYVAKYELVSAVGSDSHTIDTIGNVYVEIEKTPTAQNLLEQLKQAKSRKENYNRLHLNTFRAALSFVRKKFSSN